jgi:GTP-binding protein HflX
LNVTDIIPYDVVMEFLQESMVRVEAVVPYGQGELINLIHRLGIVELEDYRDKGTLIRAHVPLPLSKQLLPLRQPIL